MLWQYHLKLRLGSSENYLFLRSSQPPHADDQTWRSHDGIRFQSVRCPPVRPIRRVWPIAARAAIPPWLLVYRLRMHGTSAMMDGSQMRAFLASLKINLMHRRQLAQRACLLADALASALRSSFRQRGSIENLDRWTKHSLFLSQIDRCMICRIGTAKVQAYRGQLAFAKND